MFRRIVVAGLRILGALVLVALVVAVVAAIAFGANLYKLPGTAQNLANKPAVEQPAVEKPAVEKPAEEKPAVEQPATAKETPTDQAAAANAAAEKPAIEAAKTFNYTPGGRGYALAVTEIKPEDMNGETGWTRVVQVLNEENLSWTTLVNITIDAPEAVAKDVAHWYEAKTLSLENPSGNTTDITVTVKLTRDTIATASAAPAGCAPCDPYKDANLKGSALGLGWFVKGGNADVTVNGAPANLADGTQVTEMGKVGKLQMGYPPDFKGVYEIKIVLHPGGHVDLNEGEKLTAVDNWPVPAAR